MVPLSIDDLDEELRRLAIAVAELRLALPSAGAELDLSRPHRSGQRA